MSHLHFFDLLLGDAPALAPPVIYYQRLLALDQEEATETRRGIRQGPFPETSMMTSSFHGTAVGLAGPPTGELS